jgi:hypothetical protein
MPRLIKRLLVATLLLAAHPSFAGQLVEFATPRGVSQKFLLDMPVTATMSRTGESCNS